MKFIKRYIKNFHFEIVINLIKDIVNKNKDFELDLKTKDNIFTAILNVEN